ncbi:MULTISPECIES: hypothetical protein [unclassified Microcoleus]|uniref:hypothetical protein n=1 Tax=unclassified Microcoleus TaxID=2642155 RepID=UPI0025DB3C1D|nr:MULTISPECIES: hypothetical protein [unclassified Microcoleus]
MPTRNVAIFMFDDVEVLDFAGPFEVFSVTSELIDTPRSEDAGILKDKLWEMNPPKV